MSEFKIDPTIAYDVVELPSKGIYYENNKKSVRVAYLTAADENILSSPNLTKTKDIVYELLKRKVLDKDISVDELVDDDVNAILIFLRNTSFGSDYIVTLIDPKTGNEFKTTCDLSIVKIKDFNLNSDERGEYKYYMQKSNTNITFKFINKKQENEIEEIQKNWNGVGPPPIMTKRLEFMIKSVNDNRDPMFIKNFIEKLPIKDSQDFRKFVNENKPSLTLLQKAKTPSGEEIQYNIGFGVEFFRAFYGL